MKYICKDCKKEFNNPVEYCDCGNNTFNIVEDTVIEKAQKSVNPAKPLDKGNFLSWTIFSFCIVMSLFVIFFVGNPQKIAATKHPKAVVNKAENIPNIDTIWNNTPVKVKPKIQQPQQTQPQTKTIQIEEPPFANEIYGKPQSSYVPPKVVKVVTAPVKKNNIVKNLIPNIIMKPKVVTPKVVVKPKPKTVVKKTKPIKQTTKPTTKISQAKSPVIRESQPVTYNNSVDNEENIRYNQALMRKLYSKFVVGGLSGSGTCVVSFSVNSNGKLLNRKFVRISDNKRLNDTVYYMLMSVPYFSAPPQGYTSEILRLKVNYSNGDYEFSYI